MSYIGNSPGVASQRVTTTLTATAGQTQFTTQSGYVLGYVDVYLNGAKLVNGSDFEAITGTYITLFAGASAGDVVELISYVPRGLSDGYTKAEADAKFLDVGGDTASGSLALAAASLTGNLTLSGGTANGIGYLNGSKVLTTDSTLLYDGSALTLGGSAPLLRSNMSGTQSTRFGIQNSTTNGNTRFYLYPNGTGNISAINMWNNSDPNAVNYSSLDIAVIGTQDLRFSSNASGTGAYLPFTWWIGGSEAMRFNTTGLGIGTTTPTQKLHIANAGAVIGLVQNTSNTADARLRVQNTQAYLEFGQDSTGGYIQQSSTYPIVFYINGGERARIDSGGQLTFLNTSSFRVQGIKGSGFGYSPASYGALVLGASVGNGNTTVCIGVDPVANTNGAFNGLGHEVMFRNGVNFITPNSANTGWHLSNISITDGNVGIGTASAGAKLDVWGDIRLDSSGGTNRSIYFRNQGSGDGGTIKSDKALSFYAGSGSGSPTLYMTLKEGGNVGIGQSNPQALLHLTGTNQNIFLDNASGVENFGLRLRYNGSSAHGANFTYTANDATAYIENTYQANAGTVYGDIYFRQNVAGTMTTRMTIKADGGKVGINTTTPSTTLDVNGTTTHRGTVINAAGIKTYSTSTNNQGNQAITYEIARVSRDSVNWSSQIGFDITVYNLYYYGGVSRWYLSYSAADDGTAVLTDSSGVHRYKVYFGSQVTVSGSIQYRPILVDIPAYQQVSIELKYTNNEVTTINNSGQIQFTGTVTNVSSMSQFSPRYNIESQSGVKAGRTVYNWFQWGGNPGGQYLHIKTTLWSGGSPNGQSQPTMSLFHVKGYNYDGHTIDAMIGFHNWSGAQYSLRVTNSGSFAGAHGVYTSADGYVVLVINTGTSYPGISIDHHQSYGYSWQDVGVFAFSSSSASTGVY